MKKLWLWIAGGLSALVALIGLGRLLGGRGRHDPDQAQANLDNAVELGERNIADANEAADKEVADGMAEHGTLADHLNDRTGN